MSRSLFAAVGSFLAAHFLISVVPASADVRLPEIFSDHMLLQRDLDVPVWGWAEPGESVQVSFADQQHQATADDEGRWMVRLTPLAASEAGRTLTIAGNNRVAFEDVLVGDVWICSGQSNMEWPVRASLNADEEIASADYPGIRLFDVPGHTTAAAPQPDVPGGDWRVCSSESVAGFSAVGYFFGRTLHRETGVPIGLIGTNWGGTRIEPWTPPQGFDNVPELSEISARVEQTSQEPTDTVKHSDPTAIYNAMVHGLVPYGLRGAIWYQGEANGSEGIEYFHKMQALISGWREVWSQDDFPIYFYFVQLADWQQPNDDPAGGDGWARVREAQRQALTIDNTGMAVTIDIGQADDIHPRNKQDVGIRLARWALRDIAGEKIVVSGPLFREMEVENGQVRIHFDHVGDGLMVGSRKQGLEKTAEDRDGELRRFAIAGEDRQWHWADARIDGETVVVSSDEVAKPVAVRYAYSMNPAGANLYNRNGLPAAPFRTDSW